MLPALLLAGLAAHVSASDLHKSVLPVPKRQLEWRDVNFLSTSDTHGWLLGHQHATWPEPNYSGDWGAFASFAEHMRGIAADKGVDLLLVDAGDHHDGSGLVSTSPPSAAAADRIFAEVDYDVLTLGNHELYHYADALEVHRQSARWNGRYLTSNVNITLEEDGEVVNVPIGNTFAKFQTRQGRSVTAFGVLFDFQAHDKNLTIQAPASMAAEPWFLSAIAAAPEFFLLVGHMPARGETAGWAPVLSAIRDTHPLVPVYIFGGHTHVRDCVKYDGRSIGVVPGRYLETVAFTSSSLPTKGDDGPLAMSRRYLDANPSTYKFHTNKTHDEFTTPLGWNITTSLLRLASELDISTPLGKVPHDLFLSRHPYGHPRSITTEFAEKVLPLAVVDEARKGDRVIIGNAGSLRFDIFQGRFDRNDELTVSPFTTAFLYTRLPADLARNITAQMNRAGPSKLRAPALPARTRADDDAHVRAVYDDWRARMWDAHVAAHLLGAGGPAALDADADVDVDAVLARAHEDGKTLGYVTADACGPGGDDIEHVPIPYAGYQPAFIQTPFPDVSDADELDVVVMDFAMDDFLAAVYVLDPTRHLSTADFAPYAEGTTIQDVFGRYAKVAWQ
ncbi:hypothetical protein Q5752_002289 [Cryptotrichosporon argae]